MDLAEFLTAAIVIGRPGNARIHSRKVGHTRAVVNTKDAFLVVQNTIQHGLGALLVYPVFVNFRLHPQQCCIVLESSCHGLESCRSEMVPRLRGFHQRAVPLEHRPDHLGSSLGHSGPIDVGPL